MFKQSTLIYSSDLFANPDLSIYIVNDKSIFRDNLVAIINQQGEFEIKLNRDDIPLLIDDLCNAVELLITKIKSGLAKDQIPVALVDSDTGLASRGHSTLNRIFSKEALDFIDLVFKGLNKKEQPVLEIVSGFFLIPWEWLYREPPQNIDATKGLKSTMDPFWGLSYIIARMSPPIHTSYNNKKTISAPPKIGVVADDTLQFAKEEIEWLKTIEKDGKIALKIFRISAKANDWDFIEGVNSFLSKDFDILHLACHAEYMKESKLSSYFSAAHGRKYQIRNMTSHPPVKIKAPLVFFNACSTGIRNPLETFNFVNEFENAGASNVIAVEESVETEVAYNFAQTFYSYLLDGMDLGEALLKTRIDLISANRNSADVVTLFYSLYGNPRVKILQIKH